MSGKNIVLYADDDVDDIQLVHDAFDQYARNVELVTVEDGYEVLDYLKKLSADEPEPCLIILDINMPRMDGKEALMKLREMQRFTNIPAILFTTSSQKHDKEFAQKYNAGFITKPIDVTQMDIIANSFMAHCLQQTQNDIRKLIN